MSLQSYTQSIRIDSGFRGVTHRFDGLVHIGPALVLYDGYRRAL